MKSFVNSVSEFASQFTQTNYDINIYCLDSYSELDSTETKKLLSLIKQTVTNVYFKMGKEDSLSVVEVTYSCTGAPLKNVYSIVTIESETGSLGALSIKYDRKEDLLSILDQTYDL